MLVISDKGILNKTQDVRLHPVAKRLEIINATDKQASFSTSSDGITWDSPITVNALSKLEYNDKTSYLRLVDGDFLVIVNPLINEIDVVNSDETTTASISYLEGSINTLGQRITTLESKPVLTETKVSELINTSIGNIPIGLPEEEVRNLITGATSNLVSNSHFEDVLADYLVTEQIETKINSAVATKADTDTVATIQSDLANLINKYDWKILTTVQDLNTMKTQGRYFIKAGSNTNAPINTWIYVEVDVVDDTRIRQIVWADNSGRNTFKRTWSSPSWTAWEREVAINELTPINTNIANSLKLHAMITNGKLLFPDVNFKRSMNNVLVYNNSGGDGVVIERIPKRSNNPTSSTHELKVTRKVGKISTPNLGGFYQNINSAPNKVFLIKYLICLPTGYSLVPNANATGNGRIDMFVGSTSGTGKYETYLRFIQCGDIGSFSTTGFVSINGTPPTTTDLEWYIAQIEAYEVTDYQNENMESITSLQNSLNTISNSLLTEERVIELINQNKQFKDDQASWLKNFILKNVDYDKDGLTDYDEIYIHKTSALKADTDDDGMSDKYEIDRGTDPKVFTPRTTATITQFHTATRSKSNANILNVYAITDTTNTTHIEPVTVVVTSVDNSSFTATKVLSDLMFAGQTVLIPVNPVEWLRESVPNHTLTGSKFIRYSLTSQSGLNFHNGSGAFTF